MSLKNNIICGLFFTFVVITTVNGLNCYKCSSENMESCKDPFDKEKFLSTPKSETNCTAEHSKIPVCMKLVLKKADDKTIVKRGCLIKDPNESDHDVCKRTQINVPNATTDCEFCSDRDFCNNAVNGLRCYTCSTLTHGSRCDDPFRQDSDIPNDRCDTNYNGYHGNSKNVCKKLKQIKDHGHHEIIRSCAQVDYRETGPDCTDDNLDRTVLKTFCEICETDGCNSADTIIPVTLLIFTSIIIAKCLAM